MSAGTNHAARMRVQTVEPETANGQVREMYDADLADGGYIANFSRLFSLNPDAWEAWRALRASLRRMDPRRYELATLAAAAALRCRYCVGAHAAALESAFYSREELEAIVRDYRHAGLAEVDVAIMALAEQVARDAHRVTDEDVDTLRRHGLSDAEIFDVTLTAAARSFFSKTLDAMGAEPDAALSPSLELFELVPANDTD